MTLPSETVITERIGGLRFEWPTELLRCDLSRFHDHRDGRATAEASFFHQNGTGTILIHQTDINLKAQRQRTLCEELTERHPGEWAAKLDDICNRALIWLRRGDPVVTVASDGPLVPTRFLINPILPLGKPTILLGLGGAGKGQLAVALCTIVGLPWIDNPLRLRVLDQVTPSLYLDWEEDEAEITRRLKLLVVGHNLPYFHFQYRHCHGALANDIEQIQNLVFEGKYGLLVVDSLGLACGGDLMDGAIPFFDAIRRLNVTTLIVAHPAKNRLPGAKATTYGAAFFDNYSRSIWEVRSAKSNDGNTVDIALHHNKANNSRLFKPLGIQITYTPDEANPGADKAMTLRRFDPMGTPELTESMTISERILGLLKRGPMEKTDIVEELGTAEPTTRTALNRLLARQEITKLPDGQWGLIFRGEN